MSAPWFVLVAGVNGAGKSTFAQFAEALAELPDGDRLELINPDILTQQIIRDHPEYTLAAANLQAAQQSERRVHELIGLQRTSFLIETVLSTDKYRPVIERAHDLGWQVMLIYVALESADESIRRVAHRVRHGGHDVPEEKIRKRWQRSIDNLGWFWEQADVAYLFMNPADFASPIQLAHKAQGASELKVPKRRPAALNALLQHLSR